jgi:dienelactone hydrolase
MRTLKITKIVDKVPLTEYFDESLNVFKGVAFIVHGHTGNKDFHDIQRYPLELMNRGYYTISLDAYKHGQRQEEPYISLPYIDKTLAMPEVIYRTVLDIIMLFENHYKKISSRLLVSGTSMGGHIAFQMPKYYPSTYAIIPLIGSPDMINHYFMTKKTFLGDKIILCKEEVKALEIDDLSPYLNCKIAFYNGTKDEVVESRFILPFYQKLLELKHPFIEYKEFECGHVVTDEMLDFMASFLDRLND